MPNIIYATGGKPKPNPEDEIWGDEELSGLIDRSSALTQLPPSVKNIRNYTFYDCLHLALTSLPDGVISVGMYAFSSCINLRTISIGSAIQNIASNAFNSCGNLTSITINRAQDSVSGAPWGATNATVTWTGAK